MPPVLGGASVLFQGVVLRPAATNGFLAATAGLEVQLTNLL